MAMMGAVFRERGLSVKAVDAAAFLVRDGESRVASALEGTKPDAVGISLIVGNASNAYSLINKYISKLNIPVIAGGPHATIAPDEALKHGVHVVVRGEGEETGAELAEWLAGSRELEGIQGISYLARDGSVRHNPDRPPIANLDVLPMPDHDLFDASNYFERPEDRVRAGKVITSRGCPNKCSFCANPIFGRKFRYRSPASVVAELEMLKQRYGIDRFEFLDDAFTASRRRLLDLAEELRRVPDVTFSCVTRLENLDGETVSALRAAGLYRAYIGVESARKETLRRIHKNIELEKLAPTLRLLRKNGIEASLFFMFGFPWESAEEMRETNRLIKKLRPLTAWFNEGGVVAPYPGTEIYEEYHESVGFTDWWLTHWRPSGYQPLHPLQPYYFFPYDDEKRAAIREGLDIILQHNRGEEDGGMAGKKGTGRQNIGQLLDIIHDLEEQVRDRDRQLHEFWNRSALEKLRRIMQSLRGKK